MRLLKTRIQKSIKYLLKQSTPFENSLDILDTCSPSKKSSPEKGSLESPESESLSSPIAHKAIQKVKKDVDKSEVVRSYGTIHYSAKSTKNVVKNYSRAICNFCCNQLATPYLEDYFSKRQEKMIDLREFRRFVSLNKKTCDSIDRFRNMFMLKEGELPKYAKFKEVFRYLGEVFLKYFSVNWVYSGRLQHKSAHLSYRCKLLRRIKNPELFTHLKSFQKTRK